MKAWKGTKVRSIRGMLAAGMVAASVLAAVAPAAAKGVIAEANISGPGPGGRGSASGGGMKIEAPAADTMWELSGASWMKVREDSVSELGLAPADLGPRYLVTYRYDFGPGREDDLIRQELYPYADGGPVTFTPPGQVLTGEGMAPIGSGWFQADPGFFEFLVEEGLPDTKPLAAVSQPPPWTWILAGLVGLAAVVALAAPRVRRRVPAMPRVNH
jgi:hypothetical protein